ncbi:MAG: hypothetical protein II942_01105, partial [Alphaproteobacteria bacterium]|nr:hypothetical protein [Alphaproteobacteria bacterium]
MFFRKKNQVPFYTPCQEIPLPERDMDRYVDPATQKSLRTAAFRSYLVAGAAICALTIILGKLFYLTVLDYDK